MKTKNVMRTVLFVLVIAMTSVPAVAQSDGADYRGEALQQAAQNPVADMISIPLQNNFNFGVGDVFGLSDIQVTAFLSPAKPGGVIWGAGPIILMPSDSDNSISNGKWAAGPSAVALKIDRHWVYGALANSLSSFAGRSDRGAVSQWLIQPFVNYNLPDVWYLVSARSSRRT